MAGSDATEDKQLPATDKRLQEAAADGNVARSREMAHLLVMGCGAATLSMAGTDLSRQLTGLIERTMRFDRAVRELGIEAAAGPLGAIGDVAAPLATIIGACLAGAVVSAWIPGGFNFSGKALRFDPSRLDPIAGLGRIFSLRGAFDLAKLTVLATILGLVSYWFAAAALPEFGALSLGSLKPALSQASALVLGGFGLLVIVIAAVAMVDVPFQWFRHRADLKMSHDEVRRESKEADGDPLVKSRQRQRQREMSRKRMLAAVPGADVVVVNPTHYAVAIRYDEAGLSAPRVVAKGVDLLAARIQAIARESGVPVLQAPPLARALYAHVELEQEVPRALYTAIAQVLAYVYQLRRWIPGRGPAPAMPSAIPVPEGLDPGPAPSAGSGEA